MDRTAELVDTTTYASDARTKGHRPSEFLGMVLMFSAILICLVPYALNGGALGLPQGSAPTYQPVINLLLFVSCFLALVRGALKVADHRYSLSFAAGVPLLAATLSALPLYISHHSAEVSVPAAVLVVAAIAVFGAAYSTLERVAVVGLGVVAGLQSDAALTTMLVLLPFAMLAALLVNRNGILVRVVMLAGLPALSMLGAPLWSDQSSQRPDLAFHLISQGGGLAHLSQICPDETLGTCALLEAINRSDDPQKWTAAQMWTEKAPGLATFHALDEMEQAAVRADRFNFLGNALISDPRGTIGGFVGAMLQQANRYDPVALLGNSDQPLPERSWVASLGAFYTLVYAISALLAVVLTVLPERSPALAVRAVVALLLAGAMSSSLVGGISPVPSDLEGGRAVLLLPIGLALLMVFYAFPQNGHSR